MQNPRVCATWPNQKQRLGQNSAPCGQNSFFSTQVLIAEQVIEKVFKSAKMHLEFSPPGKVEWVVTGFRWWAFADNPEHPVQSVPVQLPEADRCENAGMFWQC